MEPEQGTKFSKSHLGPTREIVHDDLGIVAVLGLPAFLLTKLR